MKLTSPPSIRRAESFAMAFKNGTLLDSVALCLNMYTEVVIGIAMLTSSGVIPKTRTYIAANATSIPSLLPTGRQATSFT